MLSDKLSDLRKRKNFTQNQVAQRIGVTRSMVSAYETGIRQPSYDILISFAYIYGVSTDYLLGIEKKQYIDISDLTEDEKAVITDMIHIKKKHVR